MILEQAMVLWNLEIKSNAYKLALSCNAAYRNAVPGQFVTLHLADRCNVLLRRPFSIHRVFEFKPDQWAIEILYKVVGPFTRALTMVPEGQSVSLMGPLGNGFHVPQEASTVYLAAGGVGVAPMRFFVEDWMARGREAMDVVLFLGGRTREDVLCEADFRKFNVEVIVTTDDGSYGDQCLLTTPLEERVQRKRPDIILACGPKGMLACVAGIASRFGVSCQVSLETMMACGMGVCLGCALPDASTPTKMLHACMDGPVVEAERVTW
ncbi:MAG: dihydroorotate dehydrogenase electron transfer subunit [Thermodesulfobacteriota bacterium]